MATSDDALETYTHLPIQIDPQSKIVSITTSDPSLKDAVSSVNALHALFKSLDTPNHAPPPPMPVNPKRSAQISKLRESAAQNVKKGQLQDGIRLLGLAIDMASSRPMWEPSGLVREEMALCYMERANAHVLAQSWVEGLKDAQCSTECKSGPQTLPNGQKTLGNPRAWLIGARCLMEMGRWGDAVKWLGEALEIEGNDADDTREMKKLQASARAELAKIQVR